MLTLPLPLICQKLRVDGLGTRNFRQIGEVSL